MTTDKRNDEIDLIELFQKIGSGIKNLFKGFIHLLYLILLFFIRKSILIVIIIALGLTYGFFQFKISPRYFSSSIEAYSNAISSIDMINYVNNINGLFKENNSLELQVKLNINSEELKKIKSVKAYKIIDLNKDGITDLVDYDEKYSTADTIVSENRFVVKVEVFNPQIFPLIQESILKYIDDNKYINELNNIRKKQLSELITKLSNEINSLDSLKKIEYFENGEKIKPQAGQLLVMNEKETQLFHKEIMFLYRQKQAYERTLELNTNAITVIQDFSALSTIENNLMKYLKLYGIIGIIVSVILSIVIENIKGIKKIISDSRKK